MAKQFAKSGRRPARQGRAMANSLVIQPESLGQMLQPPGFQSSGTAFQIQRVLNTVNVEKKAEDFLICHQKEAKQISLANTLLDIYSNSTSKENLAKFNSQIEPIREEIVRLNDIQASIVGEYIHCETEETRKAFLDIVLSKNSDEIRPLFDKLINQTSLAQDVDESFKHTFLSYVLQSCKFTTGEGRVKDLMSVIGDRNIEIDILPFDAPKAGVKTVEDLAFAEKENPRDKKGDSESIENSFGSLAGFINEKREEGDTRVENSEKDKLGDLSLVMDKSREILPIHYGLTRGKDVQAFTTPMFMAIHHELGHLTNLLKGKHGRKSDKYLLEGGILAKLTDEEELHNISIDTFSDAIFSGELGLPERVAHGIYSELNKLNKTLTLEESQKNIGELEELTFNLVKPRKKLAQKISGITAGNWKPYTSGIWSKPDGVKEIAKVFPTLNNTSKGLRVQLESAKNLATGYGKQDSSNRAEVTIAFYSKVASMVLDNRLDLQISIDAMDEIIGKWFS
jgi:hypothetical protein